MSIILGIGGSIHDFSSCLLIDGNIECCIEDERLLRKKHAFYKGASYDLIKHNAADACMELYGIVWDQIDLMVGNDILSKFYYHKIKSKVKRFELINHHLSHAASAFYPSEFEEAAVLTIDGGGSGMLHAEEKDPDGHPLEVCTFGYGAENKVDIIERQIGLRYNAKLYNNSVDPVTDSIGGFYGVLTFVCGFTFHEEGKTMGLASYGTNRFLKEMEKLVSLTDRGGIRFGPSELRALMDMRKFWEEETSEERKFAIRADLAWAGQYFMEQAIIHSAVYLKELTQSNNLCIAGGVALNSVANYKLYKTGLFKNYFIQPAAGDNGTSIGSALYGWHMIMEQPRSRIKLLTQ